MIRVWGSESENFNDKSIFPDAVFIEFDLFIKSLVDRGEECIDAHRIAEALDPESMVEYGKLNSCCGSEDIGKEVNDILYMFGANYGH